MRNKLEEKEMSDCSDNCTESKRIELILEMQSEMKQDVKLLLAEHYRQQGRVTVISIVVSALVTGLGWLLSHVK